MTACILLFLLFWTRTIAPTIVESWDETQGCISAFNVLAKLSAPNITIYASHTQTQNKVCPECLDRPPAWQLY
jgi:hypothetical protein